MTMRVQSRSRAGRVKRRPRAARGEDRRGGATIPAVLEVRPFYAWSLPVPAGSSANRRADLAKKAKAARIEATKKAPRPRRAGGKVVQMDLFRAGAERDRTPPKKASKEKPARKGAAEPPADAADAPGIAGPDADGATAPTPAAAKTGATAKSGAAGTSRKRETAETIGRRQREISVAEFFQKNRHLLGFDNPAKALLTATKEAVDNSLDACEEAGILPEISVVIEEQAEDRFRLSITDNGPGIVRNQVAKVFGKLLYGSKFHVLRQSRGQQGIGISAAGMYAQLTTGQPVKITSRTGKGRPAHFFEIQIDTTRNEPKVLTDREVEWEVEHGTRVEMDLAGTYKKGRRSVDDYVMQSALANPHATVHYRPPKGDEFRRERLTKELPRETLAIKPHPYGVELGVLISMLRDTKGRSLKGALQSDFSRVSANVAEEICKAAGLNPEMRPRGLDRKSTRLNSSH